jgi:HEAT repeat protein
MIMKSIDKKTLIAVCAAALVASAGHPVSAASAKKTHSITVVAGAYGQSDEQKAREEERRAREQEARDREEETRQREQETRDEARAHEQEARDREQEARDRVQEEKDRAQEKIDAESDMYDSGTDLLDEDNYRQAVQVFRDVARIGGAHADGALYWKAYAENKLGQRADALATLDELLKTYPKSRWKSDAKSLDVEIRQSSGQRVSPDRVSGGDEDLKLMAINSLMNNDPERALPLLEGLLHGNASNKVKDRALFVLSQSHDPRAKHLIGEIARGNANPEMQRSALRYLGIVGGEEARKELAAVYAASSDPDVKRSVLKSFMISGDKKRILELARKEPNPDLRGEAIRQLGILGAKDEIAELYRGETSVDVKKQIIQAMFLSSSNDRLAELAKTEKVAELRVAAIRNLGLIGGGRSGDDLVAIYKEDSSSAVRRAVIDALFISGNVKSLIALARIEKDPTLRRELVQKLSLMGTKESSDFMLELLKE